MKRRDVIKRLEVEGWIFDRHRHDHDVYWHPEKKRPIPVKRHREIPDNEAGQIFKEAGLK